MKNRETFIYLNEQDMIKAGVNDMQRCMIAMEDMFRLVHQNDFRMGGDNAKEHGIRLSFPKESTIPGMPIHEPDKRFMAMPAYLGGRFHDVGIKCYGSNPHNHEKDLPRSILMVSLMDVDTGMPKCYMSANILSAMRTGATTGLGVKFLYKKKADTISIIGPGTMARYAMLSFMELQSTISCVKIKGRGRENIDIFIDFCKKRFPSIKDYVVCESIEQACKDSDIIYYGTTNAAKYEDNPNIEKEWLKPGCIVISASALLVKTDFLASDDVVLVSDLYDMYADWGAGRELPTQKTVSTLLGMGYYDAVSEGKIKRDKITDIGEIITGEKVLSLNDDKIVLYAVGGLPIEDVAWAHDCYNKAIELGIGQQLVLWER